MPILEAKYKPPLVYNRHFSTIWMGRLRPIQTPAYVRERISYQECDFIDFDWIRRGSEKLIILSHGLEGSSKSHAIREIARYFELHNYDVLAWNMRGCSEEPNRLLQSYNSGSSDQLGFVIDTVLSSTNYKQIHLVGISVGGNITLKYLGEKREQLSDKIISACAICPPCDLAGSSRAFDRLENRIYLMDFLRSLKSKVNSKTALLTDDLDLKNILNSKTFAEFDERFTAPVNGYNSHQEYYYKASSLAVLKNIALNTLIITAKDDPFLSPECFPVAIAKEHSKLYLEVSEKGGHVAFPWGKWLPGRVLEWVENQLH